MRTDGLADSFLQTVAAATPGGDRLVQCLQCGTCGGSCPNGPDMDFTPRALFALIAAGDRERVLAANTFWMCVSCYLCTVRCPKEIPITDIMYTLKALACRDGAAAGREPIALARSFQHFIEQFGRSFELGVASRYYLRTKPQSLLGMGPLGIRMFKHGRLHLMPNKIANIEQLQAVLRKAQELDGGQP